MHKRLVAAVGVLGLLGAAVLLALAHAWGTRPGGLDLLRLAGACFCAGFGFRLLRMRVAYAMSDAARRGHGQAAVVLLVGAVYLTAWALHPDPTAATWSAGLLVWPFLLGRWLLRWVRQTPQPPAAASRPEDERQRFDRIRNAAAVGYLVLLPFVGCGLYAAYTWMSEAYFHRLAAGSPILETHELAFSVPAGVFALGGAAPLALAALKLLLRGRFAGFVHHVRMKNRGGLVWTERAFIFSSILSGVLLLAVLDSYAVFRPDYIAVNGYWGLAEQQYSYDEVIAVYRSDYIRYTYSKKVTSRPSVAVDLADGRRIQTGTTFYRGYHRVLDSHLARVVSRNSGVALQRVRVMPERPSPPGG